MAIAISGPIIQGNGVCKPWKSTPPTAQASNAFNGAEYAFFTLRD
jgi:hypothetical protein